MQDEFNAALGVLEDYPAKVPKYKEYKKNLLINAKNFHDGREMIVNSFKIEIFPFVPSDYASDDDKSLPPDSPTSSFSTTDKSDNSNEFLLLMNLIKYIWVMRMILMNFFFIHRNI